MEEKLEQSVKAIKEYLSGLEAEKRLIFIEEEIAEDFCIHCGVNSCSGYCLPCYDI
jgi:hypothetical protein